MEGQEVDEYGRPVSRYGAPPGGPYDGHSEYIDDNQMVDEYGFQY